MPTSLKLDENYKGHDSIAVEIKTLDDIFSELCINEQTCIKIDVEGFELSVLQGIENLIKNNKVFLQIEIFDEEFSETSKFLEAYKKL